MPFGIKRQDCTDSKGNRGSYVVYNKITGKKVSCHKSRNAALAAMRIRAQNSGDLSAELIVVKCEEIERMCSHL